MNSRIPSLLFAVSVASGLVACSSSPSNSTTAKDGAPDDSSNRSDGTASDASSDTDTSTVLADSGADATSVDASRDASSDAQEARDAANDSAPHDSGTDAHQGDGAVASGYGLLPNGTRDKTLWPFAVDSIWNTPIGSKAIYKAAGITKNNGDGYPTFFSPDEEIIVMMPTAPTLTVNASSVGWSGGNRCGATGGVVTSVQVPSNYVVPNSGGNNSAAMLAADDTNVQQNQPFTRCTDGGPATTLVAVSEVSIYGTGIPGAHGGSGLSALGGDIRLGEFASGRIPHALKVELWAAQYYHCCSPIWPAGNVDGYASATTYAGTDVNLGPGALLALLPSFDVTQLSTEPAKILAAALRDYGAYIVDDVYSNGWGLCTEQGPKGSVVAEVQKAYGISMHPAETDPFMGDLVKIFQAFQIVTNNTASSIGGGGTPRVALAPAIGN